MNIIFVGLIILLYVATECRGQKDNDSDADFLVTIIIAAVAGGMVLMILFILMIRCLCLKCKKTQVRRLRARGAPGYDEGQTRRPYRLPEPPPYSPRRIPDHPPPSYESHLALPGATD